MTEQEIINEFKEYLDDLRNSNSIKNKYSDKKGIYRALDFTKHLSGKLKFFSKKLDKKANELFKKADNDIDLDSLKDKLTLLSKKMFDEFTIENK